MLEIQWIVIGQILFKALFIYLGCRLLVVLGRKMINKSFQMKINYDKGPQDIGRLQTLNKLLQNVWFYMIYFFGGLMILSLFGMNTTSLVASAGVLGLAVSFGAQNLVKDIVTGFFIIFEDSYKVGDWVQIGTACGMVEEIGLRSTKLKGENGEVYVFSNGNVSTVVNYSRDAIQSNVQVGIAYEEDVEKGIEVLTAMCKKLIADYPGKVKNAKVLGVNLLGASEVTLVVAIFTPYEERMWLQRETRKRCKLALDDAGIEIPYQKQILFLQKGEQEDLCYADTNGN